MKGGVAEALDTAKDFSLPPIQLLTSVYHLVLIMPLYDVEYICPLEYTQQEQLADALTNLHATRFKTPRCFVNVRFTDASNQLVFRGGKPRKYNRIIIRTRAGGNRSKESYNDHCKAIVSEWERIVGREGDNGLRTVWIMGALTAALEAGISRPGVSSSFFVVALWTFYCFLSVSSNLGAQF